MKDYERILLVEDDENDADLTLTALGEHNLANSVDWVHDGEEALEYLFRRGAFADRSAGNPIVVLLDIKMPKVDGLEVLRQVRSDPVLRMTPVVILTSSREESDLYGSYQLGVNAYVVKPLQFEAFSTAVEQLGVFWALVNEPPPGKPTNRGEG
ncbi:Response regulator receiver protein [Verrucomicrobia bacterium]|nr:Response regulator receiver protein [Verrucomicrobiota bacterium]